MNEQLQQQIEHYLEGRLNHQEKLEFEQYLKDHPQLKSEVEDLAALQEGLQAVAYDELKGEVKQWEASISQPRNFNWRPLAVAAAIALLLVPAIYFFQQGPSQQELFMAYYEPYEEQLLSRGENSDSAQLSGQSILIDGLEAYNEGAYDRCSDLLSEYLDLKPEDHRVALYLAIAQLELGQEQAAEGNFQKARKDPDFEQQALWYQALSHLKFGQGEKAKALLTEITQSSNHYRKAQAQNLLAEL